MKHQFTLDLPPIDFEDVSFLSILTDTPSFVLADDLNHLYNLSLHRIDDASFDGYSLPLFQHSEPLRHLDYYLLELTGAADGYLLIVRGSSGREVVESIADEFGGVAQQPHPADFHAMERYKILSRYQQSFISVSIIDFSDNEIESASRPTRRTLKGKAAYADLYARILDYIDLQRLEGEASQ